jgi:hypothetical protein
MNKKKTLEHLKKEMEFEDNLVINLNESVLERLSHIPDLSNAERKIVRENITILMNDSKIHAQVFSNLMQRVNEDERDKY